MADRSLIEWTDSTWNPWRGCDKVSPGCAHCYMFRDQRRYGRDPEGVVRAADATFFAPVRKAAWSAERGRALRERGRHLVFTCSWSDWFHPAADEWRAQAWEIIRRTPQSTYQILTKRPELISERLPDGWGEGWPNVWLGVSIENRRFVHRADLLRQVPAAVRFISAEPLLGPLVFDHFEPRCGNRTCECGGPDWSDGYVGSPIDLTDIDWLIVGGESGPGHRRIRPEWVCDLRDAALATQEVGWRCADCDWKTDSLEVMHAEVNHSLPGVGTYMKCPHCGAEGQFVDWNISGTAFFFKQWGGPRPTSGGRELDGRTWDEMPAGLPGRGRGRDA